MPRTPHRFHRQLASVADRTRQALARDSTTLRALPAIEELRDALETAAARSVPDSELAGHFAEAVLSARVASQLASPCFSGGRAAAWLQEQAAGPFVAIFQSALAAPEHQACPVLTECTRNTDQLVREFAGDLTRGGQKNDAETPYYHFFEPFLLALDSRKRLRRGVYYTPASVVAFLVRSIHESLHDEFDLRHGLAAIEVCSYVHYYSQEYISAVYPIATQADSGGPVITLLDPACGTGAFLVEVIRVVHAEWTASQGLQAPGTWDDYVVDRLLPRLQGFELMPAAAAIAQVAIAARLMETGFRFDRSGQIRVFIRNTLADPEKQPWFGTPPGPAEYASRSGPHAGHRPLTVVMGNPPYSALSTNRGRWIEGLLRGRSPGRDALANYFEVDDQSLGERKQWLHDDYVKFLRYAHWRIEESGCGIVGLVTNHGYLSNATFRGARQQLLRTFSRVSIVDLHGNRKSHEGASGVDFDENVFDIDQGVAIGLFRRLPNGSASQIVEHAELWGSRGEKLASLRGNSLRTLANSRVTPQSPFYFFVPHNGARRSEYERGFRLPDVMPVNSTAAVTARDGLVVAFEEAELIARLEAFGDASIGDQEIRDHFCHSTRSARYPAGDTRGWKLAAARRRLADDPSWREQIRTCWYRPFDRRPIFWANWMVDWPRPEISRHLLLENNVALVARRQMLPTRPCNFFWIADTLILDGVIRSDNRGSESVFPLYLAGSEFECPQAGRRVNLAEPFLAALRAATGLHWQATGAPDASSFGPRDVLHYVYAQFHSTEYRQRYAEWLRVDFPRVFIPAGVALFRRLSEFGARLAAAHLMTAGAGSQDVSAAPYDEAADEAAPEVPDAATVRVAEHAADVAAPGRATTAAVWQGTTAVAVPPDAAGVRFVGEPWVDSGFPKHVDDRVLVNSESWFESVTDGVWQFHAGAHQVARKWLKDRRRRALSVQDLAVYQQLLLGVRETLDVSAKIDAAIAVAGGWTGAFRVVEGSEEGQSGT